MCHFFKRLNKLKCRIILLRTAFVSLLCQKKKWDVQRKDEPSRVLHFFQICKCPVNQHPFILLPIQKVTSSGFLEAPEFFSRIGNTKTDIARQSWEKIGDVDVGHVGPLSTYFNGKIQRLCAKKKCPK